MTEKGKKERKKVSRRKFLVRGGLGTVGVLAVGTYVFRNSIRRSLLSMAGSMELAYMGDTSDPIIWFEITEDNKVVLYSPKVEMGQGTFTGLAQIAADELNISFIQMQVVHAPTATGNIDGMSTGGSTSVSGLWQPLRELAATMREMIKLRAAELLEVDASTLTIQEGTVSAGDKSITYAEVAGRTTEWVIPETPDLKEVGQYQFVGKPLPRIDLADKVYGAPIFGMDAVMPDMLYAAVCRPERIGSKFVRADGSEAETMPGVVRVVIENDFAGVIARSMIESEDAKGKIKVNWEGSVDLQQEDLEEMMTVGNGKHTLIQKKGSALADDDGLTLEFRTPIGAHAQLEPNGVLAYVEGDKATVILSTQVIGITRKEVAKRLDLELEAVNVIPTYLGGGFGRRLHTPHAVQAAVMSRAVGKPIKYYFSRQEEFQHDMFRPPTHHIVRGKVSETGQLQGFEHHFVSGDVANNSALMPKVLPGIIGADIGAVRGGMIQYTEIPNYRAVYWHVDLPFATSWWRSLGLLANTFAIESTIDELALQAKRDVIEFRMENLGEDPMSMRLKSVINAVANKAGYTEEIKNGRAMGLASSIDAGTPCAQVAEVSIEDGEIKVHKVTVAMDPGIAVNPDQVRAQCEGCVIMGMSASMFEEMKVVDGSLQPIIYGPYRMALMKHAPKEIDVVLLQGIDKPGPVGEPPLGPIAAAIGNAVRRLTGKRLTRMPLNLSQA